MTNNTVATDAQEWWQGGGGIYVGGGGALDMKNCMVSDNKVGAASGGGILAMQGTTVNIAGSTISANVAGNSGGGFRSMGAADIVNSTFSGNAVTDWMGGAIFHTDGVMHLVNTTVVHNTAPPGASGGIFVGTFTEGSPTLTLVNNLIAGNSEAQCFYAPWGSGMVNASSLGNNLVSDVSCFPVANDLVLTDAMIGPLVDNGGPTLTHALLPGSLAIDAADDAACPAVDQRGVARPQGDHCDIGAFEAETP